MSILKQQLRFIAEMIAALSICFSIIWSIQVDDRQSLWLRKVETLNILNNRDRKYMLEIKKILPEKVLDTISANNLIKIILSDSILRGNITDQLTQYERISIGANIGIYEDDVIKRFIGSNFISFNKYFKPFINHIRVKNMNPNLYLEYDKCILRLQDID